MAEVLDQETLASRPPSDDECFAYEPPPAFVGMQVSFWPNGKPNSAKPESAFVVSVPHARKTVTVWRLNAGHSIANVRHVSDPRLVKHTNLRDQGVWDYTEHDSQLAERFAAMEKRLTALEGGMAAPDADKIHALESKLHGLSTQVGKLKAAVGSIEE